MQPPEQEQGRPTSEDFDALAFVRKQLRDSRKENARLQDGLQERSEYVAILEARLLLVYDTLFEAKHGA